MANAGYLGGNSSWDERLALIKRHHLRDRPRKDLGMRNQCRCGQTIYTWWRQRWYCIRCGRWMKRTTEEVLATQKTLNRTGGQP